MIYGRFGYGLASRMGGISLPSERTSFAVPFEPRGAVRIVDLDESARVFPPLYEQVFAQRAGMFTRSKEWWETRRLFDDPARRRGGPKTRVLLELDGEPAGYAIYFVKQDWGAGGASKGVVTILEVVTPTPEAARELWRWLFDFDWTSEFNANMLPLDHELFMLLAEPRRMQFTINEGVWVRLIDVDQYRYGFETAIESDKAPKGLSEDTVRFISDKKNEPACESRRPAPSAPTMPRTFGWTSPVSAPSTSAATRSASSCAERAPRS